ncbi:hypothetical protein Tco_0093792 [Tanacetum coccineum]
MLSSETKKGAENLAADHLSRLENPHQDKFENKEITETFPLKTLGSVVLRVDSTPWFADFNSMLSSETKKGAENLAADHLSRLENPHQDKLENKDEDTETFPLETLGSVALRVDSTPWFADFATNYHAGNF